MSSPNVAHPGDVLLTIFSLALPPSELFKQRNIALKALRLVCFHWNAVIVSNPIFWSTLDIHIPSQNIPCPVIISWLERSANAALDISLGDIPPTSWTLSETNIRTELLSAIQPHISHCRSLQLDVSVGLLPAFKNLRFSDANRLEYFCVNMKGNTSDNVHQNMIHQLCSLPKLHHLSCTTNYSSFATSLLQHASLPWFSRLRHIEVSCPISPPEMMKLFTQCTSAHSIILSYVRSSSPSTTTLPESKHPVKLSNLRTLSISLHPDVYRTLSHNFSFPNLQILKIQGPNMPDLSLTLNQLSPSLQLLKLDILLHPSMHTQLSAFIKHEGICNLPIFEAECREYQIWEEYEGWEDSNGIDESASKKAFCELIEELNRELRQESVSGGIAGGSRGDRLIKYDAQNLNLYQGCFIGWVDASSYMKFLEETEFAKNRNILMIQPHLFSQAGIPAWVE